MQGRLKRMSHRSIITALNRSRVRDSAKSLDVSRSARDTGAMQRPEIDPIHLVHVNPALNMARFYGISVQPTLFGEISVMRNWGRIGTRGQAMVVTYADAEEACTALGKLERQKRRRGYSSP